MTREILKLNTKLVSAIAAALGLAAAGTASADLGKVGVYGKVNLSYQYDDPDTDVDDNSEWDIHSNASRVGLWAEAGQENLGAFVLIEFESDAADGGLNTKARNQVAGFKGTWGSAFFGRHDTPFKTLGKVVEQFNDYSNADIKNLNQNGVSSFNEQRQSGSWNYRGAFEGLGIWVQANQQDGSQGDDELPVDDINASVTYKADGLTLGLAVDANDSDKLTATRWVASYAEKNAFSVGALIQTAATNADDDSSIGFVVSGSLNLDDANVIKAQVGIVSEDDDNGQVGNSLITLGWEQKASKNVKFFAYASQDDNDTDADGAELTVGGGFQIKFGNKAKGLY